MSCSIHGEKTYRACSICQAILGQRNPDRPLLTEEEYAEQKQNREEYDEAIAAAKAQWERDNPHLEGLARDSSLRAHMLAAQTAWRKLKFAKKLDVHPDVEP